MDLITLGGQFKSFIDFTEALEKYKKDCLNEFYIRDCRTIESQKRRSPDTVQHLNSVEKQDLKYYQLRYCCIHGGRAYRSNNNKISNRKTK